jgi:hypothetical protein
MREPNFLCTHFARQVINDKGIPLLMESLEIKECRKSDLNTNDSRVHVLGFAQHEGKRRVTWWAYLLGARRRRRARFRTKHLACGGGIFSSSVLRPGEGNDRCGSGMGEAAA